MDVDYGELTITKTFPQSVGEVDKTRSNLPVCANSAASLCIFGAVHRQQ